MSDFEDGLKELIREAPCSKPGFVFKPYVETSEEGQMVFAYWENVAFVSHYITPEISLHVDRETGRIVGVSLGLPQGSKLTREAK